MPMRLQELHPALVHFPITLFPTALGVDAIGRASGNQEMMNLGRKGIGLAVASMAVAGVAGLLAQEAVQVDENARKKLVTHRTLNMALLGFTSLLASRRMRTDKPSLRYLMAGLAGVGVMGYSAYLGGNMVYEDGVGVAAAGGLREENAPHLEPSEAREALRTTGRNLVTGTKHAIEDMSHRDFVPWLRSDVVHEDHSRRERDPQPLAAGADGSRPDMRAPSRNPGGQEG